MEIINQYHQVAGTCVARIFLGLLFFFQGYDSVFKIKMKHVISAFQNTFVNKGIPNVLIVLAAWFTSCTALIAGFLLIFGLFEYFALFLLAINLIIAAVGFGINTPMWDTGFVFPRLLLLLFLLIVPVTWNNWSLDYLLFKN